MVQVVVGGSGDFNAMVYGYDRHPGTMNFLENQFSNISSTLTDAGRSFFSNAKEVFESFTNSDAMRTARAALRKAGSMFQRDEIRSIWDLGEMQNAPPIMQRWIMANPTVRSLWQEQRCDGFSDSYVDNYVGQLGDRHYDFRRARTGVVEMLSGDSDADYVSRQFIDDLVEGDRELDTDEKADIDYTWEVAEAFVEIGKDDMTSVFGASL